MSGYSMATQLVYAGERRAKLGITEGLLRVSAGIEEVEDIIADIEQAFAETEKFSRRFTQMNTDEERFLKADAAGN